MPVHAMAVFCGSKKGNNPLFIQHARELGKLFSHYNITLIYGGVALLHVLRISHDGQYANFFMRPMPAGERGLRVGVRIAPE